jgi:hypothetical protein
MRERLIELLDEFLDLGYSSSYIADYLLENGVVVPTIAIDDTVYRIGQDDKVYEWLIAYIQVYKDENVYIDDSDNYIFESDIGKTVFLSREEAERALRKEDEGK